MKVLKALALALLGLLLATSLTIFGLAFTLNSTILNPGFIRTEIEELDISTLVQELVNQTANQPQGEEGIPPEELVKAVTDTVTQLEPLLKERVTATTDSIYEYLLGKRPHPNLALALRGTILKTDFFTAIIDKLDITVMVEEILRAQLGSAQIPPEFQRYVDASLDKVVADMKPIVKQQFEKAADPVLDYLVGTRESFSVTIDSTPFKNSLRTAIHDAVFASLPPEFAQLPSALRESLFDQIFNNLASGLPSSFVIDQGIFDPEVRTGIADGLKQAEDGLTQARLYVGYFQLGYKLLIVLMLLSTLGIILIHRQIRGATRSLGSIFLSYGAVEYAGVLVGRYFAGLQLPSVLSDVPPSLQGWVTGLSDRLIAPLGTFSLALLIAGVVLFIVSFVYPKPKTPAKQATA